MRWITALLFGTALLRAEDSEIQSAAFYLNATSVAIVVGKVSGEVPRNAAEMPGPNLRPPFGKMFAIAEVSNRNGFKTGDKFDINLTGNLPPGKIVEGRSQRAMVVLNRCGDLRVQLWHP
jgi:hypothetical protein